PHHIRQILQPELGGVLKALELGLDLKIRLLAFDLGFSTSALQQIGALKTNLGRSTLQAIMHRLASARHGGRCTRKCSRGSLRLRAAERSNGKDQSKKQVLQSILESGGD